MSLQDDVVTRLLATAGLVSAFTGGIKAFDELGGLGLSRDSFLNAFRTDLRLNPVILVRERSQFPTNAIHDEAAQHQSYVQTLEVWFYTDRADGWDTLHSAQATVYGLLHAKACGKPILLWREHGRFERDPVLDQACLAFSIYDAHGVITP